MTLEYLMIHCYILPVYYAVITALLASFWFSSFRDAAGAVWVLQVSLNVHHSFLLVTHPAKT